MAKRRRSLCGADKELTLYYDPSRHDEQMDATADVVDGYLLNDNNKFVFPMPSLLSDEAVTAVGEHLTSDANSTDSGQVDVDDRLTDSAAVSTSHYIATRSATGRLAKRPRRDLSPARSPPRKILKEESTAALSDGTPEQCRRRRQWKLWSTEDKNLFFEGLFEHGKDFDAIQNLICQKHKKRGEGDVSKKSKEQIRHFYYRTWHKISHYISPSNIEGDVNKQALELLGLICYNEMRRKVGTKLDEKIGRKLNELIYKGSTTVGIRGGKKIRIKIPNCRALKKLTNIEELKDEFKVPERILIELRPRTKAAWFHVQSLSHNPRLLINMFADRRLSCVIDFLNKKWRFDTQRANDWDLPDVKSELLLNIPSNCCLSSFAIQQTQTQPKTDFCFASYLSSLKAASTSVAGSSPQCKRSGKSANTNKTDEKSKVLSNSVSDGVATTNVSAAVDTDDTDGTPAAGDHADVESHTDAVVASITASEPTMTSTSSEISASCNESVSDKVDRLRQTIDRATAQLYTIAEVYLMMNRPARVAFEYDWAVDSQNLSGITADKNKRLRRLVDVAVATFTANDVRSRVMNTDIPGSPPFVTAGSSCNLVYLNALSSGKGSARSPRCRSEAASRGRGVVGRSPSTRNRKDTSTINSVAEATIDQSANCSWSTVTIAAQQGTTLPVVPSVNTIEGIVPLEASSVISANNAVVKNVDTTVFRVPTSFPLKVHPVRTPGVSSSSSTPERTIVDRSTLQQMPIFNRLTDLTKQSRRPRKLNRVVRKPMTPRTLLPKVASSDSQVVSLSVLSPDTTLDSAAVGSLMSSGLNNSITNRQSSSSTEVSKPAVITMTPTEFRKRRIVPTPVTVVPCDSLSTFPPDTITLRATMSAPEISASTILPSGATTNISLQKDAVSSNDLSSSHQLLASAITGVDVFLESSDSQSGLKSDSSEPISHISGTSNTSAALLSGADSLDISLTMMPEAGEMGDKLLDLALANSNSSFPGLLDSNSMSGNGCEKELALGASNSTNKNFGGAISRHDESSWLGHEDISLSSFLADSPAKRMISAAHKGSMSIITSQNTLSGTTVHFGESSRDSLILAGMDASLQCMLNENSFDLSSKFAELIAESSLGHDLSTSGDHPARSLSTAVATAAVSSELLSQEKVV